MTLRIGIDLGGTKTELVALDTAGQEHYRIRAPTPSHDYAALIAGIVALVAEAEQQLSSIASIGIGTPGSPSPATGLMRNANTQCLNGKPLQQDLSHALQREVRIANDANCFALSEAIDGAGRGAQVVFGVILGTGTGGAVVINQQVLKGHNAIAGEWGHNPLPWPTPEELSGNPCFCGKRGCIETFVSGTGFARDHQLHSGETLSALEITQCANAGQPQALASLERYYDRLARALASVINLLDPEIVVLGGGMSRFEPLYSELQRRLPDYVFSDCFTTPVVPAAHGDASGVRGAAWLWPS
ncbi:ROK family protein [Halopseudomonas pelagia]|uniref:ROK family protein n=1 Tax=Halopseudomonas pelagia TaxID=553151 RepID=UPI0030DB3612|tara:strand:+ start:56718 stop:57620 length:903 start_codon:yes stop_codon:yes gene_type:complete